MILQDDQVEINGDEDQPVDEDENQEDGQEPGISQFFAAIHNAAGNDQNQMEEVHLDGNVLEEEVVEPELEKIIEKDENSHASSEKLSFENF